MYCLHVYKKCFEGIYYTAIHTKEKFKLFSWTYQVHQISYSLSYWIYSIYWTYLIPMRREWLYQHSGGNMQPNPPYCKWRHQYNTIKKCRSTVCYQIECHKNIKWISNPKSGNQKKETWRAWIRSSLLFGCLETADWWSILLKVCWKYTWSLIKHICNDEEKGRSASLNKYKEITLKNMEPLQQNIRWLQGTTHTPTDSLEWSIYSHKIPLQRNIRWLQGNPYSHKFTIVGFQ